MQIKISSGFLKGRRINVPDTDLRPTGEKVRSAFFDTVFSMINFDERNFLDIFSGTGAMSFEAISRGFKKAVAVENNFKALSNIRLNAQNLGIDQSVQTVNKDGFISDIAEFTGRGFNTVYIDPPYRYSSEIPALLDNLINCGIPDCVCIFGIETGKDFDWSKNGWNIKRKKYGGTFLTFIYNWE